MKWRFAGFYNSPDLRSKVVTWELLKSLNRNGNFPWVVGGDFNDILYAFEKKGGLPREEARMEKFRETLKYYGLADLGFTGKGYTWERGSFQLNNIMERLDRYVDNMEWWSMFPSYEVTHLEHPFSDHCLVLLSIYKDS